MLAPKISSKISSERLIPSVRAHSSLPFTFTDARNSRVDFCGMRVVFLGTSSARSSPSRNTTSILIEGDKHTWIFDCGDGTQRQLTGAKFVKTKLQAIFITHLHGDHVFGLPSLVCHILFMDDTIDSLRVFGPVGIAEFLHTSLKISSTSHLITSRIEIIEFVPETSAPKTFGKSITNKQIVIPKQGTVTIMEDSKYRVKTGRIVHSIPCFGYVLEEKDSPGNLSVEFLDKYKVPMDWKRKLLKQGRNPREVFPGLFPDNVDFSEMIGPTIKGRKIVVLGDTCDPSNIVPAGKDCDLLIHESTFEEAEEDKALQVLHSSSRMAGLVAKRMEAKALAITHFSVRYKDDYFPQLVDEAHKPFRGHVIAAKDNLAIDIPLSRGRKCDKVPADQESPEVDCEQAAQEFVDSVVYKTAVVQATLKNE